MALNLKNQEVERLATEVARLAGTTKTEAIRQALAEKKQRLEQESGDAYQERVMRYLTERLWPSLPPEAKRPITKEQEDELFGYGPDGLPS